MDQSTYMQKSSPRFDSLLSVVSPSLNLTWIDLSTTKVLVLKTTMSREMVPLAVLVLTNPKARYVDITKFGISEHNEVKNTCRLLSGRNKWSELDSS